MPEFTMPPSPPSSGGNTPESVPQLSEAPSVPVEPAKPPTRPRLLMILGIIGALAGFAALAWFVIIPRFRPEEVVTLEYWGLWEPESVMAPVIAKFEADHPNTKVAYRMESKVDYRERLQAALGRGQGPDIFRVHASWIPMFVQHLAAAPSSVLSADDFRNAFYPVAVADLIKNEQVVGIPLMVDTLGLFVNNELLSATSSGVPTNWDEFRKVAFSLTKRNDQGQIEQAGAAMGSASNIAHWSDVLAALMLQNSVDLARPASAIDARGRNLGADALRFYTIFTTQDQTWDESLPPDIVAFANGKLAMMFAPSWQAFEILNQNPQLDFSIHPIPQLVPSRRITWATYWVEGVARQSTHQREAWEFLKFLSSREALEMMYAEAVKFRAFGEPYPRQDMASILENARYVGAFVEQAPDAKTWFMSSWTGDNGLNDEILTYYADAVNKVNARGPAEDAIATVEKGVEQVLTKFGLLAPRPTSAR